MFDANEETPVQEENVVASETPMEEEVSTPQVEEYVTLDLEMDDVELLRRALQGEVKTSHTIEELITALTIRMELPEAWSEDEIFEFLLKDTKPAQTERGNWVKDKVRAKKVSADWTTGELEDWAELKLDATQVAPHAQLALELKARLNLQCGDTPKEVRRAFNALKGTGVSVTGKDASKPVKIRATDDVPLQLQIAKAAVANIEQVEGLTPMQVANIDDTINRYVEAVKPGSIVTPENGLKAQNSLDNLFNFIINMEPQAMVVALERLKVHFQKHMQKGGVFDDGNVYRFTHLMREENHRRAKHIGLLEAMRVFFGPVREARKQVDLRQLLQYQPNDKMELLVQYFTQKA